MDAVDPDDLDDDSIDSADSEPDEAPEAANIASSFRDDLREQDHASARLSSQSTSLEDEIHGRQGMFEAWKCVVETTRSSSSSSTRSSTRSSIPSSTRSSTALTAVRQSQSRYNTRQLNLSIRRDQTQAEIEADLPTSRASTPSSSRSRTATNTRGRGTRGGRERGTRASSRLSATPTPSDDNLIPVTRSSLRDEIVVRSWDLG
ncbi:hypothetical protein BGZ61DRAFT_487931 [Ilyonectria robusta]|uniref:uncharacterized protein n=1 Tax=Ilyonectria robusta TaxID=1079257 RepID=UPI001E8DF371|nr:uncharacterized protein BGZ61DRAFT_487931 [Ilyonectria robusta]KAH8649579.1 hypothetical protein BGZ61DRAFT_487931 [Ilyonectria robusta]